MFWIHTSSTARVKEGYRGITEVVKLAGREDPKVNILRLVRAWLRDESNGKWIIIVDKADDLSMLSDLSGGTYIYRDRIFNYSSNLVIYWQNLFLNRRMDLS